MNEYVLISICALFAGLIGIILMLVLICKTKVSRWIAFPCAVSFIMLFAFGGVWLLGCLLPHFNWNKEKIAQEFEVYSVFCGFLLICLWYSVLVVFFTIKGDEWKELTRKKLASAKEGGI